MTFRILSLDGGGTWALLQAMALEDLYPNKTGHEILSCFDLAVANSGGSIVLAGLALDFSPTKIRTFFEDQANRESIFYKKPFIEEEVAQALPIFPRYVAAQKRVGLGNVMGAGASFPLSGLTSVAATHWPNGWPLGPRGAAARILIVAFDYDRLREDFLRSYPVPKTSASAEDISLADAVHASTNAPVTFFDAPAHVQNSKKRYWDGAMGGYNNPLMAAVVDAISLGASADEIEILSIGTGTVRLAPPDLVPSDTAPSLLTPQVIPGVITDAGRAGGCITDDPPDAATYTAHVLLGNDPAELGRVVRLSPVVQPVVRNGAWTYPDALPQAVFDPLTKLSMDAVEAADVALIKQLGTAWISQGLPNQPLRMGDDLRCLLGDPTYAQAKERWDAIVAG